MKIITKTALLFISFLFLTSCSSGGKSSETESGTAKSSAGAEITREAEKTESEEITYMEKYKHIIEEIPQGGITEKRENVPYPEFRHLTYYSSTAERDTPVNVLLPSDYSEEKKYPVLYVLHGYYGNEYSLADKSACIAAMLTNLCRDGEAREMIVVLPYIYCSKDMPVCTGMDLQNSLNYDNFINDLTADLMPFIENNFSVAGGRENTAITGFSMGGRESLFIGFSHPELFGYIGAVCPAPGLTPVPGSAMHPGQMQEGEMVFDEKNAPFVLLISAAEKDNVVDSYPMDYHDILNRNGTEHLWHLMTSTGHDNSSVVPHLYNFMRVIFE